VVFINDAMRIFCLSNVGVERSTTACVQFVGDSVWWSSSGLFGLPQVAALAMANNVGDDGAGRDGFFDSSPIWWWCGVLLCALFVCGGVSFDASSPHMTWLRSALIFFKKNTSNFYTGFCK
jgi:hypothetical protein